MPGRPPVACQCARCSKPRKVVPCCWQATPPSSVSTCLACRIHLSVAFTITLHRAPATPGRRRALRSPSITECDAVRKLAGIRPVADRPDRS